MATSSTEPLSSNQRDPMLGQRRRKRNRKRKRAIRWFGSKSTACVSARGAAGPDRVCAANP